MKNYKSIASVAVLAAAVIAGNGFAETQTPSTAPSAEETIAIQTEEGIPGGIITNTLTLGAEVVAIDHAARTCSLLMPGGETVPLTVGPEVVNFDLIQKGDRIKARVKEELAIYLGDESAAEADGMHILAERAAKGEQPGGMVIAQAHDTATVTAIDLAAHTATLKFEDGTTNTADVRADVDLSKHKVGDKVVFELTRMITLSIVKQ